MGVVNISLWCIWKQMEKTRSMCKWMQIFKQKTLPLSFQIPFCCKCGVRISKDFSSLDFFAFCFIGFNAVLSNVDPLISRIPRQHFLGFRQHEMTSWNCYSVTFPRWDAICHCFCICFHFSACQFAGCRVDCLELRWSVCYMSGTYYLCCEANETDRCHNVCGFCFCRSCGLSYFEPGNMAAQFQSK